MFLIFVPGITEEREITNVLEKMHSVKQQQQIHRGNFILREVWDEIVYVVEC